MKALNQTIIGVRTNLTTYQIVVRSHGVIHLPRRFGVEEHVVGHVNPTSTNDVGSSQACARAFGPAANELFDRIMQMTDNAGSTDRDRALNYCAVRYPAIYAKTAEAFAAGSSLSAVEVNPSPLSGTRNIVEVVFSHTNRNTDYTEKCFARVDVTEEFPFLVTKMSPYYDR